MNPRTSLSRTASANHSTTCTTQLVKYGLVDGCIPFCSTSLLLARTRWVQSTFELCAVHSLSSVLAINLGHIELIFLRKYFRNTENTKGCWVRSAMPPPMVVYLSRGRINFTAPWATNRANYIRQIAIIYHKLSAMYIFLQGSSILS